jgi:hypothetical protein
MLDLTDTDQAMLGGERGEAVSLAMRILVRMADAAGASRMIDVTGAHIDSCLYHGEAGLDFAERLSAGGGRVVVPTTLNVSSLDLLHPALFRGDGLLAERGRRLMRAYVSMGGKPTFTCAPYQSIRPAQGEHIAWAESNAIVFANSVLGARTDRYGDFIDICAAITGRVPEAGLHLDEHRRAEAVFHITTLSERVCDSELFYPILGHLVGRMTGSLLPAIVGLPGDAPEDGLKALGAAASSSGGVAMFHAVGRTPEAPTLDAALGGGTAKLEVDVDMALIREARNDLSTANEGPLAAVSVGTPHFSLAEFERLASLVAGERFAVDFFVNTSRDILAQAAAAGLVTPLRDAGVEIVTDTCTYITPILRDATGVVMTNSGKWAYYAPGNLGVEVAFGSLEECVASAAAGAIERDESVWA